MLAQSYRFGDFLLDPAARGLRRGDEDLQLSRKAFDCIVYLIENRDRAIGREELIQAIWGHTELTDNALGQTIRVARQAFDDTGDEQHFIKTVRGYGYHWITPVEILPQPDRADEQDGETEAASPGAADVPPAAAISPRNIILSLLAAGTILLIAALYFWPRQAAEPPAEPSPPRSEGEIALLLPVVTDPEDGEAWIRLGLMDLIAARLRTAGQAMVPSDTIIALMHNMASEPGAGEVERLGDITGSHLIFAARANTTGARWTVDLHSLSGAEPPLAAAGEAHDVLEAARIATDGMVRALGLAPAPEPEAVPGFQELKQRIEAARLSQRMDVARQLIEQAPDELRRHPEIRFQWGRVLFYSQQPEAARAEFEQLLEDTDPKHQPALYARALNGLAAGHALRGERAVAQPLFLQAADLLERLDMSEPLGTVYANLGNLAQERGEFDAARTYMAQARRVYEAIGNIHGLAQLDGNAGVLETRRSRYARALSYFERAADRFNAIQSIGGELRARAYMMSANRILLNLPAAAAVEPRLDELLGKVQDERIAIDAKLTKAALLTARGRSPEQVNTLLEEALEVDPDGREGDWVSARLQQADQVLAENPGLAAELAGNIVERLEDDEFGLHDDTRSQAWLVVIRAHLARRDLSMASTEATAMEAWVRDTSSTGARIHGTLATAEVARAGGREQEAMAAYERALALAEQSQVPLYLLDVAESCIPWLLDGAPRDAGGSERALSLVESLVEYADSHYHVALLQLRVYHAFGPVSAWRAALGRARALAGEREIPAELRRAP